MSSSSPWELSHTLHVLIDTYTETRINNKTDDIARVILTAKAHVISGFNSVPFLKAESLSDTAVTNRISQKQRWPALGPHRLGESTANHESGRGSEGSTLPH